MATKKTQAKTQSKQKTKSQNTDIPSSTPEYAESTEKDYKIVFLSEDESDDGSVKIITAEDIQKQSEQWMYHAMQHFDNGGRQYSVIFNENSPSSVKETSLECIL